MSQVVFTSRIPLMALGFALAAGAVATIVADPASARDRRRGQTGYVTAHSEYGNGSVSGPVRWTQKGRQVRLPGGTWVYCERSCSETLRLQSIDFWYSREGAGHSATTNGGGFFGKLRKSW